VGLSVGRCQYNQLTDFFELNKTALGSSPPSQRVGNYDRLALDCVGIKTLKRVSRKWAPVSGKKTRDYKELKQWRESE